MTDRRMGRDEYFKRKEQLTPLDREYHDNYQAACNGQQDAIRKRMDANPGMSYEDAMKSTIDRGW